MDGEAGWWTTSGNIGLPPLARAMGVGRQQQQHNKIKEEDSWAIVAKKIKSHNVFEGLDKVESDLIVKTSVIMKDVKSTNEEKTRKKRIMIFNLKIKTRKIRCGVCKDGFMSEL